MRIIAYLIFHPQFNICVIIININAIIMRIIIIVVNMVIIIVITIIAISIIIGGRSNNFSRIARSQAQIPLKS